MLFFLLVTEGFSKCSLFLTSERTQAFSHCFLNLFKTCSKDSPSRTYIPGTKITPCVLKVVNNYKMQHNLSTNIYILDQPYSLLRSLFILLSITTLFGYISLSSFKIAKALGLSPISSKVSAFWYLQRMPYFDCPP